MDTIPSYVDREAFLEHYGIPGMRWGKRTSGSTKAAKKSKSKKEEAPDDPDFASTRATLNKPLRKVSNKELQELNQRLQLEQNYSKIKNQNRPSAKVDKAVKGILAVGAAAGGLYALYNSKHGQDAIKAGKAALKFSKTALVNNRQMRELNRVIPDTLF